jgi:PPK2 family polyphosphate:nucleotide phosphotransferase
LFHASLRGNGFCGRIARVKDQPVVIRGKMRLKDFDPDFHRGWDKEETKANTADLVKRIGEMQELLYANGKHAVLLLFQGLDASGKDGAVKCVLQEVNPAGVETANFKVPSSEERAHDFLWRVHKAVPRFGNIGVFNRSHYEAVLVERILGLASREVCKARFGQIVDFERMLVANGVLLLKFFLHISKEEQAERFRERLANPHKNWKFSEADLETRKHWPEYMKAYEDVLNETSHPDARWHLVPADRNWFRNYVVARTVVTAMEGLKLKWPKATQDLSKFNVI